MMQHPCKHLAHHASRLGLRASMDRAGRGGSKERQHAQAAGPCKKGSRVGSTPATAGLCGLGLVSLGPSPALQPWLRLLPLQTCIQDSPTQPLTLQGTSLSLSRSLSLCFISWEFSPAWKMTRGGGLWRRLVSQPAMPRCRTCSPERRSRGQGLRCQPYMGSPQLVPGGSVVQGVGHVTRSTGEEGMGKGE